MKSSLFARRALCLALVLLACPAFGAPLDRSAAEADTQAAMTDGKYGFCTSPSRPLSRRALRMCPIASELSDCAGFAKVCEEELAPQKPIEPPSLWSTAIAKALGYLALAAVGVALLGLLGFLVLSLVRWLGSLKEDQAAREVRPAEAIVQGAPPTAASVGSDAEVLLREAAELASRGHLDLALFTYLGAALRALDDRGAIRIARHRTHGEYVRGCRDGGAKPGLREIALDVDRVRFGGQSATSAAVERAAARAVAIVRAPNAPLFDSPGRIALMIGMVLALSACHGGSVLRPGSDPAGDDLLLDLLVREGATARHMTGALASLPMKGTEGPAVIVDTQKTHLDDETQAHLLAWVEQGGVLILAGDADEWPKEVWAKRAVATGRDARVETPCPPEDDACAPPRIDHIRLAAPAAMTWPHEGRFPASAALDSGELYAAVRAFKKGKVLGLASEDLLTNAGLSVHGNPSSLVALLESLDKTDFLVTRAENGVSPPDNPFAGLVRIGLGLGLAHALVFSALLFLSVGIRHARPVPVPPPPRRAFAEHVKATGALYERTRATGHALHAYAEYVDRELRAKAPRGTSPAAFLAQRAESDPKDTAECYARALAARAFDRPNPQDLLVLRRLSALFSKAMASGR
jgi:Domain of unknown function (DUF4129)